MEAGQVSSFHEGIWGWRGGGLGTMRQSQSSKLLSPCTFPGVHLLSGEEDEAGGESSGFEQMEGAGQVRSLVQGLEQHEGD